MRTAVALVALTVVASGPTILGQRGAPLDRPPVQFSPANTEAAMVAEGCLQGNRLRIALDEPNVIEGVAVIRDFILEGAEALIKQLRQEHDGHQDEMTGMVIIPADRDVQIQGKRYGRTRVTASSGVGPGKDSVGTSPAETASQLQPWLRMKVTGFRHLASTCSIRVPTLCVTAPCTEVR